MTGNLIDYLPYKIICINTLVTRTLYNIICYMLDYFLGFIAILFIFYAIFTVSKQTDII